LKSPHPELFVEITLT